MGFSSAHIGFAGLCFYIYSWEYREPLLDIHFLSLDRGRAIFIRTPENKTILVGGGQNSQVIRGITDAMPFYSRSIDYVVIPSAVPAQIGGLIEVIERYEIGEIIMPKLIATSTVLTQLMREVRKNKIHTEEVQKGDIVEIEHELKVSILFPYDGFKYNKTSLPELGLKIQYGDTAVYLIGNLSKTIQKDILKNTEIPEAKNILEFYHSMADGKVSAEFLEALDPEYMFSTKEKTAKLSSDGSEWNHSD